MKVVYKCSTAPPEEIPETHQTEEEFKFDFIEEDLATEQDSLMHNVNRTEPTNAQLCKFFTSPRLWILILHSSPVRIMMQMSKQVNQLVQRVESMESKIMGEIHGLKRECQPTQQKVEEDVQPDEPPPPKKHMPMKRFVTPIIALPNFPIKTLEEIDEAIVNMADPDYKSTLVRTKGLNICFLIY